jgi:hypothetical protein
VAQQKKFVARRMMNCGDRTACESDMAALASVARQIREFEPGLGQDVLI